MPPCGDTNKMLSQKSELVLQFIVYEIKYDIT